MRSTDHQENNPSSNTINVDEVKGSTFMAFNNCLLHLHNSLISWSNLIHTLSSLALPLQYFPLFKVNQLWHLWWCYGWRTIKRNVKGWQLTEIWSSPFKVGFIGLNRYLRLSLHFCTFHSFCLSLKKNGSLPKWVKRILSSQKKSVHIWQKITIKTVMGWTFGLTFDFSWVKYFRCVIRQLLILGYSWCFTIFELWWQM